MKRLSLLATLAITFAQPAYAEQRDPATDRAVYLAAAAYCVSETRQFSTEALAVALANRAAANGIPLWLVTSDYVIERAARIVSLYGCERLTRGY